MANIEVLVLPTLATLPPATGSTHPKDDRQLLSLVAPFNLSGHPACAVPCGFTDGGLPIGMQLVGRPFDEATVLRAADAFQRLTDFHVRRPVLA